MVQKCQINKIECKERGVYFGPARGGDEGTNLSQLAADMKWKIKYHSSVSIMKTIAKHKGRCRAGGMMCLLRY